MTDVVLSCYSMLGVLPPGRVECDRCGPVLLQYARYALCVPPPGGVECDFVSLGIYIARHQ